jgi:hypothetical protein
MNMPILAPAAVLVLWSVFMMYWLMAARLPAMAKIGVDLSKAAPGGRGQDIDPNLPPPVAWKSHNYAHLMEQPTVFYAAVAILAISGGASQMSVYLAWGYTVLRVIHSVWQSTVNTVSVRFMLFVLYSLCLTVLAVQAVLATI